MKKLDLSSVEALKKTDQDYIDYYRDRMSDTTLGKFKERMGEIIAKVDEDHVPETPVRQLAEQRYKEDAVSCWTGKYYIHFAVSQERGE